MILIDQRKCEKKNKAWKGLARRAPSFLPSFLFFAPCLFLADLWIAFSFSLTGWLVGWLLAASLPYHRII
jgi:hypothetical protein